MSSPSGSRRGLQVLLVTLLLLVVGFAALMRTSYRASAEGTNEKLSTVYRYAQSGQIVEATLLDEDAIITGTRCDASPQTPEGRPVVAATATNCAGRLSTFHASYPKSDSQTGLLIQAISASGASVEVDKQGSKAIGKLVVTFVFPLLFLANLIGIIFLSRSADGSVADIAGFGHIGRNRQRKKHSGTTGVTFADVAGAQEAVTELREVTEYLTDPKKFEEYGAAVPKGVLLFGSPGCGKTLLARAVAGESQVPFFSISGAEFVESLVGVGAARVRDLFRQVRQVAPAIVFIDEIDAVGRRRGSDTGSGGEREQTVNQLLVEMDGFEVDAGIVVMAATNRPDILDPALLRPGRFDRHITVEPPDVHGRLAILGLHAKSRPLAPEVDLDQVARRTPGFTGADLANVIREGALLAIRQGSGTPIGQSHLTEAVQRVLHGPQRRGRIMSAEERKRIAYHEAGHALVAAALGCRADIPRISIVARGRGLGQSIVSDDGERVLFTTTEMSTRLAIALAGIAAEELTFGEPSTSAKDDIDKATWIAREMVGLYGMSGELGRQRLMTKDEGYLQGGDGGAMDAVSSATMATFDDEVKRLLDTAEETATRLLERHHEHLNRLVAALEDEETIEGPALESLLSAVGPEVGLFDNRSVATSRTRPKPARAR